MNNDHTLQNGELAPAIITNNSNTNNNIVVTQITNDGDVHDI